MIGRSKWKIIIVILPLRSGVARGQAEGAAAPPPPKF